MNDLFGNPDVQPVGIQRELIVDALAKLFQGITEERLVGLLYSEFEAVVDYALLCNGGKAGQKISMLFNPHRYSTPTLNSESIISALNKEDFAKGLARAVAWKEGKYTDLLFQVLQLGINGVQYVNEFPPHVARDVYCQYGAKRILDPCAGWGGRMIGAASVGAFYHAFEPSSKTYSGLLRLGEWLKLFKTGFDFHIEDTPFEDGRLDGQYDIALTSPPYFDTEKYSLEPTQAANRYQSADEFADKFFKPLVERCTAACKNGLVINIGSRRYPMRDWLQSIPSVKAERLAQYSLSGTSGLGKGDTDGETFWRVMANNP